MSDSVSYVHAFITFLYCALSKSTCANFLREIICLSRNMWRLYAITITKCA
ncbi:amino acid permease [Escherichia coli]|nr:amino acid permease [Escherichia coli]RZM99008.1 amino acid permease [Escherichia sp. E14V5]RZN00258.1 amino acid permease [Escherichia sp. E14V7]RZN24242.1 amino acid permease [Escherichia sp. E14V10]TGB59180.1 amino acid permease [Escherichia sp. E5028]